MTNENLSQITDGATRSDAVIYSGRRDGYDAIVTRDGETLTPDASLKIRNHSPTGFAWGYCGSGPAQLALAILLDFFCGDAVRAERYYQDFKAEFVATWGDADEWEISGKVIREFIESH